MKIIEVSHCDSKKTTAAPVVLSLLACGVTDASTGLKKFPFDCKHHLCESTEGTDGVTVDNIYARHTGVLAY